MRLRLVPVLTMTVLIIVALIAPGCGSDGSTNDGGLPEEINLAPEDPNAPIGITFGGFFYANDQGPRLCASLAESFPPQCFDEVVVIEGSLDDALASVRQAADGAPDPLQNEGDVWWTDGWVHLSGTLQNNRLVLD